MQQISTCMAKSFNERFYNPNRYLMTDTQISFSQTNSFSKLIVDYLAEDVAVQPFYQYRPTIDAIEQVIADKQKEAINRNTLSEAVWLQYESLENIPAQVSSNIHALNDKHTFCIVTAHQLNIFGGPLYLIYKIAQTISTCKQLKEKYPAYNFVPVYWLGSEDHDFEEINHIHLFNKKIEWTDKQGGATGAYSTQSILSALQELKSILGESSFADELMILMENAYHQETLTKASRYLANALFGKHGLVVIDGDDALLKRQFISILKDELLHQTSHQWVLQQNNKLENLGYKQQAYPREINLFYLSKNSRERIEYHLAENKYVVLNTSISFSREAILQELEQHPERFSPNVILRPLYQQKVLPALAYIGGGGELSYWLQLKTLFEQYSVCFPQLILRNSALLIHSATYKKIEKMHLSVLDFFQQTESLKKYYITQNTKEDLDITSFKLEVETTFIKLQELAKEIDPTLVGTVGAELQKSLQSMDNIQKRLVKSLKQKNETTLNQIEKIKMQLFPENTLQERIENFSAYYIKYGSAFIDDLVDIFDVYNKQFLLIQLP